MLPSLDAIGDFLCHALPDVPGVESAGLCFEDRLVGASVGFNTCDQSGCTTNGSRPAGAPPRPAGAPCPAANVPGAVVLPVETVQQSYGRLVVVVGDALAFDPYRAHLRNLASFVAMAVENRDQRRQLEQLNSSLRREIDVRMAAERSLLEAQHLLEQKVQERTAELRESEGRLRLAQEAARLGTWDWDLEREMVRVSDGEKQIYGLTAAGEVVRGADFAAAIHPDDRPRIDAHVRETLRGKSDFVAEFRVVRSDGTVCWVSASGKPIADEGGRPVRLVGISMDITERKRLEQELSEAQKLESIGRLAGGVAHDFNNLLTAILAYTDMADEIVPAGTPSEYLAEIRAAANRAADLTRQLLAFARRQVVTLRAVDLNTLIEEIAGMLRRLIGEDIEFRTDLEPGLWPVLVDPGQIGQVLTNLAVNARDAMPHGGRLTARTANRTVNGDLARLTGIESPGDYVQLFVTDTGSGMSDEVKERVFEPFFTTKELGRGTGLGLASSFGIVKQSRGYIRVDSRLGEGTTFVISFPRVARPAQAATSSPPRARTGGQETVLLAEDDLAIRTVAAQALRRAGYQVLIARDGRQAKEIGLSHDGPLHLLVTDVVMPRMGGRDLAAALCASRPALKVLFVSGYPDQVADEDGLATAVSDLLPKPFTPAQLQARVREILDRPPAPPPPEAP